MHHRGHQATHPHIHVFPVRTAPRVTKPSQCQSGVAGTTRTDGFGVTAPWSTLRRPRLSSSCGLFVSGSRSPRF